MDRPFPVSAGKGRASARRDEHLYLRLIAGLKIAKGLLLLGVAVGLLFLDIRAAWFDAVARWVEHEMLLPHYNLVLVLLRWIETLLTGSHLRSIGLLALVYAALLLTEGTAVWFERPWGEWMMVVATGGLIPLEAYHLLAHPSLAKLALIVANGAIVVYLARLLRRRQASRGNIGRD